MSDNQKIIELKRRINNDDFRSKEAEIREQNKRGKIDSSKSGKKRKFNLINFIFAIFLIYFAYTAFNQYHMIESLNIQIAEKNEIKAETEKVASELKEDVEKISENDDEMFDLVEKIARNQYKMVKPNETIYIDRNRNENKFINVIGSEEDIEVESFVKN